MTEQRIVTRVVPKPVRDCDGCTACCTALGVPDAEAWTACPHECAGGCSIYRDRPNECATFECAWRMGLVGDVGRADDPMRPDRHGVVYYPQRIGGRNGLPKLDTMTVHEATPGAAFKAKARRTWRRWVRKGWTVLILQADGTRVLEGDDQQVRLFAAVAKAMGYTVERSLGRVRLGPRDLPGVDVHDVDRGLSVGQAQHVCGGS